MDIIENNKKLKPITVNFSYLFNACLKTTLVQKFVNNFIIIVNYK